MSKGTNKMDNKSGEQFILMQAAIETNKQEMKSKMKANKQYSDEKMMQFTETFSFDIIHDGSD